MNAALPVPGIATMLHPARQARFHQPQPGLQRLQIETVIRTGRDNQPASAHRRRCERHRMICRLKGGSKRKALSATHTRSGRSLRSNTPLHLLILLPPSCDCHQPIFLFHCCCA